MKTEINKLSVIMPFYKESHQTVLDGIKIVSDYLQKVSIKTEIFISQNGTSDKLTINTYPAKIIFDKKKGLGRAIKNGISQATGEYCYFVSIQVPYNLTDIKSMISLYSQADIIIGSKLHNKSIYKINWSRKLISRILSKITILLLPGFNIKDPNGTIFGKTSVFKKYGLDIVSDDYFYSTEFLARCKKNNVSILEVPVTYIKEDSSSSVKLMDGIKYLGRLLRLSWKYNTN